MSAGERDGDVMSAGARGGLAGMLLTGGRSSRMGRDKATMPWVPPAPTSSTPRVPQPAASPSKPPPAGAAVGPGEPTTWSARAAALLAAVAAPVIEVGPGSSGLLAVRDEHPGEGPLLAVVTGWRQLRRIGSELPALVLGCDLPLLSAGALRRLAAWPGDGSAVPVLEGRPQWCCARYSNACLQRAAELAAEGRRDLRALGEAAEGDGGGIAWLGPDELGAELATLADADSPEDLAALGLELAGTAPAAGAGSGGGADWGRASAGRLTLGSGLSLQLDLGLDLGPLGFGTVSP